MAREPNNALAIVGGGISGLISAMNALDRGAKDVHVYEANAKGLGGKIQTGYIQAGEKRVAISMGPEFIDKEHTTLVALAQRLGVKLEVCEEQSKEVFQAQDGTLIPDFIKQYAPIAKEIIRIREAMQNDPELKNSMKSTSAKALLQSLGSKTPAVENPSLLQRVYNLVTFSSNRVSQKVIDCALAGSSHDLGMNAENVTAAQFISETSPNPQRFLASTCDYRVEGGTAAIIDALRAHLEERGVQFHLGHNVSAVQKQQDGGIDLTFETAEGTHNVKGAKVIMAVPTYALSKIKGLEFLKLEENQPQYNQYGKLTVALKPGVATPDANYFLGESECWSPADGLMTFLVHNHDGAKPAQVIQRTLANAAQAFGTTVEQMFDMTPGKFLYNDPKEVACLSVPSPKNAVQMERLFAQMEKMTDQGIGFVSTYLPLPDGGVGFMECGAHVSERLCDRMFGRVREVEAPIAQMQQPMKEARPFAERILAEQANRGGTTLAV